MMVKNILLKYKVVIVIFVLLIVICSFNSCEKVITVDLATATPHIVIEGMITDSVGPYIVKLSKSGSYFNQPILPPVTKAIVVISDNTGIIDTLKEKKPGIYLTSKIQGIPGRTYNLTVISENITYSGTSSMFSHVEIDTLQLEKNTNQRLFGGNNKDVRKDVHCIFNDPNEKNYYRLKSTINDSLNLGTYRLYDDQYTNSLKIDLQSSRVNIGDTCIIELISLDKSMYSYYQTLNNLLRTNPFFGSTPANPNTNLNNGALGYFGACAISSKKIIITEKLYNLIK